jgi:predicted PurR-regulated permease PerM
MSKPTQKPSAKGRTPAVRRTAAQDAAAAKRTVVREERRLLAAESDAMKDLIISASFRRQVVFWVAAAAFFVLFLIVFSPILLPFAAGMALAYFLDPVADWLQRRGLSRVAATCVILIGFVLGFALSLMILIPVLSSQLSDFISRLPDYLSRLQALVTNIDAQWLEDRIGVDANSIRNGLNSLLSQATGFLTTLLQSLWNSGKALIDIVGLLVVTPVVAFYMLLDWDRMVDSVDRCVPRNHLETVRQLARDINESTAGFVRGQGTLCLILGVMYAIGLTAVGLNFGLLIGFIPYVGSLVGLVLAVGVAFVQFWPEWQWIVLVAVVFFTGQFIEGNILQPRLVGKSVGLHPVWLMFALFAFGYLFGFLGLLIAVPAAAAVAVLVRFAIARYMESPMYSGQPPAGR